MKLLICLIFFTAICNFNAFACQIQVPTSEAIRYIEALEKTGQGVPPLYKCEDKPNEKCHCADDITWEHADFEDDIVIDYLSKVNELSCLEEKDCDTLFESLVCEKESQKVKNYDQLQVYCAVPVMKIDGKKLVNSKVKKAAHEAAKKAEKDAGIAKVDKIKLIREKLKLVKKSDLTSNAKTVDILMEVIELIK